jgi:hypothetical protein
LLYHDPDRVWEGDEKGRVMQSFRVQELKGRYIHGHLSGTSKLVEYRLWGDMIQRCENPNNKAYDNYGGRGISVCDRWRNSFEYFLYDMGFRPSDKYSLDRIDVNRGYFPENVRWATREQQRNNTRTNRFITAYNRTYSVMIWSRLSGLNRHTIRMRIKRGATPEEAIPIDLIKEWPEEPTHDPIREKDGYLLDEDWLKRGEEVNSLRGANLHKEFVPEYHAWKSMKGRCLNPKDAAYHHYGGRGIGVHEPWIHSFPQFLTDVGPRPSDKHSLHRLDNNRSYMPGNVCWALKEEQIANRRNSLNLTYRGITQSLSRWSKETGIPYSALQRRIQLDWTPEQILTVLSEGGRVTEWGKESGKKAREGYITSEETRQKMRDAKKNLSEEARRNMSEAHKGIKQSKETVEKRAQKLRGRTKSPEHVAKLVEINRARYPAPIGQTFGRLTVLDDIPFDPTDNSKRPIRFVRCLCSCGKEAKINLDTLKRGGVQSCGCLKVEMATERLKIANQILREKRAA